jgi:hypothetical protein
MPNAIKRDITEVLRLSFENPKRVWERSRG